MFKAKVMKVMGYTLLVYALLVGTHLGEFWPFSIFPMFSKAGKPWTRSMVTDVTHDLEEVNLWLPVKPDLVPGKNVPLRSYGVDQIDYANFVSKTKKWTPERIQALRDMLSEDLFDKGQKLMIYKVRGELTSDDNVSILATPFLMVSQDSSWFNPNLPITDYFRD